MAEQSTNPTLDDVFSEYAISEFYKKVYKEKGPQNAKLRADLSKSLEKITGQPTPLDGASDVVFDRTLNGYNEYAIAKAVDYAKKNTNEIFNANPAENLLQYTIEKTSPSDANIKKYEEEAKLHKEVATMGRVLANQDVNTMKKELIDKISDPILKQVYTFYANNYTEGVVIGYKQKYGIKAGMLQSKFAANEEGKFNKPKIEDYLLGNLTEDKMYLDLGSMAYATKMQAQSAQD